MPHQNKRRSLCDRVCVDDAVASNEHNNRKLMAAEQSEENGRFDVKRYRACTDKISCLR